MPTSLPRVTCKSDVLLLPRPAAGAVIDAAIVLASSETGLPIEITCGTEDHPPTDPHTRGVARDIGVLDCTPIQILQVMAALKMAFHQLAPSVTWTILYEVPSLPVDPQLAAVASMWNWPRRARTVIFSWRLGRPICKIAARKNKRPEAVNLGAFRNPVERVQWSQLHASYLFFLQVATDKRKSLMQRYPHGGHALRDAALYVRTRPPARLTASDIDSGSTRKCTGKCASAGLLRAPSRHRCGDDGMCFFVEPQKGA